MRRVPFFIVRICEKTFKALAAKQMDLWDVGLLFSVPSPALFGDGREKIHSGRWRTVRAVGWNPSDPGDAASRELWERAAHG